VLLAERGRGAELLIVRRYRWRSVRGEIKGIRRLVYKDWCALWEAEETGDSETDSGAVDGNRLNLRVGIAAFLNIVASSPGAQLPRSLLAACLPGRPDGPSVFSSPLSPWLVSVTSLAAVDWRVGEA